VLEGLGVRDAEVVEIENHFGPLNPLEERKNRMS
jgi:hypothetical protein